jgi:hypothetical protein
MFSESPSLDNKSFGLRFCILCCCMCLKENIELAPSNWGPIALALSRVGRGTVGLACDVYADEFFRLQMCLIHAEGSDGVLRGGFWVRMLLFGLIFRAHSECTQTVGRFWVDSGLKNQEIQGDPNGGTPPDQEMLVTRLPASRCGLDRLRSSSLSSPIDLAMFQAL